MLRDLWGSSQKYLSNGGGIRNKNFESQWKGQRKKYVPKRAINLSEQLPWVYMGFYTKKIAVSVKSSGPIAWSWK